MNEKKISVKNKNTSRPSFQKINQQICANCKLELNGRSFETIFGKQRYIRSEGYIGSAFDSFTTVNVFLCDSCVSKSFRKAAASKLVLALIIVLFAALLFIWPAVNNFSTGYAATGFVFLVIAAIPILVFCIFYLPNFLSIRNHLNGKAQTRLSEDQLLKLQNLEKEQGEKLAKKINLEAMNSDTKMVAEGYNLFLTPREYQVLLKKSTTEIPKKK